MISSGPCGICFIWTLESRFAEIDNIKTLIFTSKRLDLGTEVLREGSPSPTCDVSCVTCPMSHAKFHYLIIDRKNYTKKNIKNCACFCFFNFKIILEE